MRVSLHRFQTILSMTLAAILAANAGYAAQSPKKHRKHVQLSEPLAVANCSFKHAHGDQQALDLQSVPWCSFKHLDETASLQAIHSEVKSVYDVCSGIEAQIGNDICLKQQALETLDYNNKSYEMVKSALELQPLCASTNSATMPFQLMRAVEALDSNVDASMVEKPAMQIPLNDTTQSSRPHQKLAKPIEQAISAKTVASETMSLGLESCAASLQSRVHAESSLESANAGIVTTSHHSQVLESCNASLTTTSRNAKVQDLQSKDSNGALSQRPALDSQIASINPTITTRSHTVDALARQSQRIHGASAASGIDMKSSIQLAARPMSQEKEIESSFAVSMRSARASSQLEDVSEGQTIFVENVDWFSSLQQMYLRLQYLRTANKSTSKILRAIDRQLVKEHDKSEMLQTNSYVVAWSINSKTVDKTGKSDPVVGFRNAMAKTEQLLATTISQESGVDFTGFRTKTILRELESKMKSDNDVSFDYYVYTKDLNCLLEIQQTTK